MYTPNLDSAIQCLKIRISFFIRSEVTLNVVEYEDETYGPDDDSNPRLIATARVDMIIEAGRQNENKVIVLILEHKKPGTLDYEDWFGGIYNGQNMLVKNARHISKQSRKYLAALHNIIRIYDTISLVGMHCGLVM